MVTVTGFTKDKLLELDGLSFVESEVNGDVISLVRRNGTKVLVTGSNKGPAGSGGVAPTRYFAKSVVATSIPHNTFVDVTGYSFVSGTSGLFTLTSGTTFTATQAGIYYVSYGVYYATGPTATRRIAFIYKDGVEQRRVEVNARNSNNIIRASHALILAVGSVLKVVTYQSSGVAVSLASAGHDLRIVKIA